MKMRLTLAVITAVGSMGLAATAQATTYDFSYQAPGFALTGVIDGALQPDGNTILMTAVSDVAINGVAGPAIDNVTTEEQIIFGGSNPPETSLDGTTNVWFACSGVNCDSNLLFDTTGLFGAAIYDFSGDYGPTSGLYSSTDWSISAAPAPEPAAWAMMLAGFGLLGAGLRQRRRQVVLAKA